MARRATVLLAFAILLLAMAGCSNFHLQQRAAWRGQAENACLAQRLIQTSAFIRPAPEIDDASTCGLLHPFKVYALQYGAVAFNSAATLDCPMIAQLDHWLTASVQPAASARFGQPVVQIDSMGSYACRGMNNQYGAQISEHAYGNALDIGGFKLADGREISLLRDWWHGDDQARAFLADIHMGACQDFTTVLAPGSNAFHYNHIHVDLAMHGNSAYGPRRVCKPAPQIAAPAVPRRDDLPEAPDIDEEFDSVQNGKPRTVFTLHPGTGGPDASVPPDYDDNLRPSAPIPMPRQSWVTTSSIGH